MSVASKRPTKSRLVERRVVFGAKPQENFEFYPSKTPKSINLTLLKDNHKYLYGIYNHEAYFNVF